MSQTTGHVTVRKNAGANVGTQPRLNLIEGANVGIAIVEDPVNHELDITLTAAGASATAWVDQFYPASDPDGYHGTYATMLMDDDADTLIRQTFMIPDDIVSITRAVVILIPEGTGNLRWTAATNFAQVCDNEDYQTHTDSIAATTSAVTTDEVECISITAALTGAAGGDIVGLEFTRTATNAGDTVNASVHFLGILIQGSVGG